MIKLLINDLEKIVISENISSNAKEKIDIFLSAINDWPNELSSVQDYVLEIEKFIDKEATKTNIDDSLLLIDVSTKAWQAESLSQIVEIFKLHKQDETLSNIVADLAKELNDK